MSKTRTDRASWAAVLLGCGLLASSLFNAANLRAEEAPERAVARRHFAQGVAFAKRQAYAEALLEFQRAYAAVPHFSVLYNIGQAQVALGQSAEAVSTLQRYLDEAGVQIDAQRRAEVEQVLAGERAKLPAPAAAAFETPTPEPPAPAPTTPTPSTLTPSQAPPAPPPVGTPSAGRSFLVEPIRRVPPDARRRAAHGRTLAYVVTGAGLALSGGALAHYFWNRGRYAEWQTKYDRYHLDPTEPNRAAANRLSESVDNASVVTIALAVGAGVALGTGGVLWLTSAPSADPRRRAFEPFLTAQGRF
jgi:tetratricopeptide (TPR) repeat protein